MTDKAITDLKPGDLNPAYVVPKHSAKDSLHNKQRISDANILTHLMFQSQKQEQVKLGSKPLKGVVLEIVTKKGDAFVAGTSTAVGEKDNRWQARVLIPLICHEAPGSLKEPLSEADQIKMNRHWIFTAANSDLTEPSVGQYVWCEFPTGELNQYSGICLGVVSKEAVVPASSATLSLDPQELHRTQRDWKQARRARGGKPVNAESSAGWPTIQQVQARFKGVLLYGGFDHLDGGAYSSDKSKNGAIKSSLFSKRKSMKGVTGFVIHDPADDSFPKDNTPMRYEKKYLKSKFVRRNVAFWTTRSGITVQPHLSLEWPLAHANWCNDHTLGSEVHEYPILYKKTGQMEAYTVKIKGKKRKRAGRKYTLTRMADSEIIILCDEVYKKWLGEHKYIKYISTQVSFVGRGKQAIIPLPSLKQCEATFQLIKALNASSGKINIPLVFPASGESSTKWLYHRAGFMHSKEYEKQTFGIKNDPIEAAALKKALEETDFSAKGLEKFGELTMAQKALVAKSHISKLNVIASKFAGFPKTLKKLKKDITRNEKKIASYQKRIDKYQNKNNQKLVKKYTQLKTKYEVKLTTAQKRLLTVGKQKDIFEKTVSPKKIKALKSLPALKRTQTTLAKHESAKWRLHYWWWKKISKTEKETDKSVVGITAHNRWTHGDGGPIEYYCAARLKYSKEDAFYAMAYSLTDCKINVCLRPNDGYVNKGKKLLAGLKLDGFTLSSKEINKIVQEWPTHLNKKMKCTMPTAVSLTYDNKAVAGITSDTPEGEAVATVVSIPEEEEST